MIEYIVLSFVFIAFTLASIEDLRKREVYDYINFSLAFFILIVGVLHSLILGSFDPIKYVGFGMIIGFAFGAFLFYLGIWGGGDAKFLLGFSGSVYYLITFIPSSENVSIIYSLFLQGLSYSFQLFLDYFLSIILVLDVIFIVFLLSRIFIVKTKKQKKDILFVFITLFILYLGLYFKYDSLTLILIGFIVFVFMFMAPEGAFDVAYIRLKKSISDLKEKDRPDSVIKLGNKYLIGEDAVGKKLSKIQIHNLRDSVTEQHKWIYIRKTMPYATLIGLNYVVYLFKVVTFDSLANMNLQILSFMLKFMFFSFMAGGIIAVFLVFYLFFKNFKQVKLKFSKLELSFMPLAFIISIILSLIHSKFYLLFLLFPIYIFIKLAKSVEHVAFVKRKSLDDITLGDWIVQDIRYKHKLIYSTEDFKIGVDEFQLAKIKELAKHDSNLKEIWVKDGIAFLPALYFGFILILLL